MKASEYFQAQNFKNEFELCESVSKTYEGTEVPIQFLRLPQAIETGQDALVLSRGLAEAIIAGKLSIKDAELNQDDPQHWGLIRPAVSGKKVQLW